MHDDDRCADTPRCVICGSLLYADELGRFACLLCQKRGMRLVRAMPGYYRQLGALLEPGGSRGEGRVTGSKSAPLPCSETILNLRARGGLVTILATWEDAVRDELGFTTATFRGDMEQTLDGVVAFLANNAPWIYARFAAVDDYHQELQQMHGRASVLVTGEKPERPVVVQCPCGGRLRITLSTPGRRCQGCGEQYGWQELRGLPLAERSAA